MNLICEGRVWEHRDSVDRVIFGFTKSFLDSLSSVWSILPGSFKFIHEASPLFTITTSESLFGISSPLEGRFVSFNSKARDFPDRLKEEDDILVINPLVDKSPPTTSTHFPRISTTTNFSSVDELTLLTQPGPVMTGPQSNDLFALLRPGASRQIRTYNPTV